MPNCAGDQEMTAIEPEPASHEALVLRIAALEQSLEETRASARNEMDAMWRRVGLLEGILGHLSYYNLEQSSLNRTGIIRHPRAHLKEVQQLMSGARELSGYYPPK
jgi:hypothetical protein